MSGQLDDNSSTRDTVEQDAALRTLDRKPQRYRLSFSHGAGVSRVRHRKTVKSGNNSSESGTEADNETESKSFPRALPAPYLKPRKGLKVGEDEDVLLMPSQLDDEGRRIEIEGYFIPAHSSAEEEDILFKRRLHEFARRCSEVGLMAGMLIIVMCGKGVWSNVKAWKYELLTHLITMVALVAAYPVRLSILDSRTTITKPWQRFRVPASFDPATVLYPPLLGVMVALCVSSVNPTLVLPNIILGLSSLPQRLFPRSTRGAGFNILHWLISMLPFVVGGTIKWLMSTSSTTDLALSRETLICLYPLHHALIVPLHWLTTDSLLVPEVHLLSIALINLLFFARAPQAVILKACLWIGGLSLFLFTHQVLQWNITLARVPRWKLRRPGRRKERRSLVDAIAGVISLQRATKAFTNAGPVDSDADEDHDPALQLTHDKHGMLLDWKLQGVHDQDGGSIVSDDSTIRRPSTPMTPRKSRRNTLPAAPKQLDAVSPRIRRRSRIPWFLQLTPVQVDHRKLAYAIYTYAVIVIIILGPIRSYISEKALFGAEAIGWAIGYLFGQVSLLRDCIEFVGLEFWIPLPPAAPFNLTLPKAFPLHISSMRDDIGAANTHLLLIAYWVSVLGVGLIAVFTLTPYVEVDTRRKIFHGVMVAMFLPATYIDPCYCALALALVLTIFLLLEVIRAAQVPPLGTAIARFIAPYVDGRDLRGPVVVSHLFLAIGCAVPLWFSLAGIPRQDHAVVWQKWETEHETRDVGMLAGVICVGMGDAAASLIGRRYGRRKWPWVGGKSLEGSTAFAVAVTIGLLCAKIWLWLGGWNDAAPLQDDIISWINWISKAMLCACGASFLEAVLTGANDNVACPIALWLLVKVPRGFMHDYHAVEGTFHVVGDVDQALVHASTSPYNTAESGFASHNAYHMQDHKHKTLEHDDLRSR